MSDIIVWLDSRQVFRVLQLKPQCTTHKVTVSNLDGNLGVNNGSPDVTDDSPHVTVGSLDVTDGNLDVTDGNLDVTDGKLGVTDGNLDVTVCNLYVPAGNPDVTDGNLDVTDSNLDVQAIQGSEAMTWPAVTWGMPRGPRPPVKLKGTHLDRCISLSFSVNAPTCSESSCIGFES